MVGFLEIIELKWTPLMITVHFLKPIQVRVKIWQPRGIQKLCVSDHLQMLHHSRSKWLHYLTLVVEMDLSTLTP